jgi:Ca2+/Na+ antiporter
MACMQFMLKVIFICLFFSMHNWFQFQQVHHILCTPTHHTAVTKTPLHLSNTCKLHGKLIRYKVQILFLVHCIPSPLMRATELPQWTALKYIARFCFHVLYMVYILLQNLQENRNTRQTAMLYNTDKEVWTL